MYRYQLDNHYERIIPSISVIYLPLSKNGFADILSINLEYTLKLKKSKNKINEIPSNLWEDIKKYTNPYELIYIFNNKREQNIKSIAKFRPLSRSFFKMIEIIHEFIPNINTKNIAVKITFPNTVVIFIIIIIIIKIISEYYGDLTACNNVTPTFLLIIVIIIVLIIIGSIITMLLLCSNHIHRFRIH
jgi:hypothetical protein